MPRRSSRRGRSSRRVLTPPMRRGRTRRRVRWRRRSVTARAYSAGIARRCPAETVTPSSAFRRTIASTTSRGSASGATSSAIDHSDSPDDDGDRGERAAGRARVADGERAAAADDAMLSAIDRGKRRERGEDAATAHGQAQPRGAADAVVPGMRVMPIAVMSSSCGWGEIRIRRSAGSGGCESLFRIYLRCSRMSTRGSERRSFERDTRTWLRRRARRYRIRFR